MRNEPANKLRLDYFDYIAEDLINCEGLEGVQHVLDSLLSKYGFKNYIIFERDRYSKTGDHLSVLLTDLNLATKQSEANQSVSSDSPTSDSYTEVQKHADQFVEFVKSTNPAMHSPFVWIPDIATQSSITTPSEATGQNNADDSQFRAIAMQCNPDKLRDYFFFFHGNQRFTSHVELAEIGYLVHLTSDLLAAEHAQSLRKTLVLGNRERQCLDWTAQGKTSFEISKILDLSEHTVNNYIVSATRKLGASNRAHAIAKALRLDLI